MYVCMDGWMDGGVYECTCVRVYVYVCTHKYTAYVYALHFMPKSWKPSSLNP